MILSGVELIWLVIGIVTAIVVAAVYITSAVRKQNATELKDLADTRGETIEDLRKEMAAMAERHRTEIEMLHREVAELRGHLTALERLKVDQIAERVVQRLVGDDDIDISGL